MSERPTGDAILGSRVQRVVLPLVALTLVATLLLSVFGADLSPPRTPGASGFSVSALGHKAFIELLGGLGIPIELSRANSGVKAEREGVLLLAEPDAALPIETEYSWEEDEVTFARELRARAHILVLPKRVGVPHPFDRSILYDTDLVSRSTVTEVLGVLSESMMWEIARPRTRSSDLDGWRGEIEGIPEIDGVQLLERRIGLEPLLECDRGVLVGVFEPDFCGPVVIISDPDLIAHHSIDDGDNFAIAAEVVRRTLLPGESLVVDEEFHGLGSVQGFWRRALSFPAVFITVQCALLFLLVLWAALGRFGPARRQEVGLEAGSRRLVDSTAELLRFGRHGGSAIRKYLRLSIEGACRRLHGPETGSLSDRLEWLSERERTDQEDRIADLAERVRRVPTRGSEDLVRDLALRIDRWRWEIVHGDRGNAAE